MLEALKSIRKPSLPPTRRALRVTLPVFNSGVFSRSIAGECPFSVWLKTPSCTRQLPTPGASQPSSDLKSSL